MKHGVAFRKFSRTSSHRNLMLRFVPCYFFGLPLIDAQKLGHVSFRTRADSNHTSQGKRHGEACGEGEYNVSRVCMSNSPRVDHHARKERFRVCLPTCPSLCAQTQRASKTIRDVLTAICQSSGRIYQDTPHHQPDWGQRSDGTFGTR